MINTYVFSKSQFKSGVQAGLNALEGEPQGALLWIDLHSFTDEEIIQIAENFGFHPVTLQSCLDRFTRPHLWEFDSYFYTNLTSIRETNSHQHTLKASELHLFVGADYVITAARDKGSDATAKALELYKASPLLSERGPVHAVYTLVDILVESYYPYIEKLDSAADRIEDTMLQNADKRSLAHLFTLKRKGHELRKLLGPQRDIFGELARRNFKFASEENRAYFQDTYNRTIRLFDVLDTIREVLSASLDIYLSSVSNRLNEVMKILTIVSTVMMALGFITGFFGMNFIHLPWLHAPNAFRNLLIAMGLLVLAMLYAFRRKGWL